MASMKTGRNWLELVGEFGSDGDWAGCAASMEMASLSSVRNRVSERSQDSTGLALVKYFSLQSILSRIARSPTGRSAAGPVAKHGRGRSCLLLAVLLL